MSAPCEVHPKSVYAICRRCIQRQYILQPDAEVCNAIIYCAAEAAQRYGIKIISLTVEANHYHGVVEDPDGNIVEFETHFHSMVAKCLNAYRGRTESLWSSDGPSRVRLLDPGTVIDKIVYAVTNPVKDGLVERTHHWPGVNLWPGRSSQATTVTVRARRPRFFFSPDGVMPEEITLHLALPEFLGDANEVCALLRERVASVEEAAAAERAKTGRRILGRKAIRQQSWRASPASVKPRGQLRPRFAGLPELRIAALAQARAFRAAYRAARRDMMAGLAAIFPLGTYWLRRFAGVPVAESP